MLTEVLGRVRPYSFIRLLVMNILPAIGSCGKRIM